MWLIAIISMKLLLGESNILKLISLPRELQYSEQIIIVETNSIKALSKLT